MAQNLTTSPHISQPHHPSPLPPHIFTRMSSSTKKRLRAEEREISPPPLRRKIRPAHEAQPLMSSPLTATTGASGKQMNPNEKGNRFEILSWNVNGISHLLPQMQTTISSFFVKGKTRAKTPDTDDEAEAHESRKDQAPLKTFLKRHDCPQIVCLQEVKIAAKDEKTRKAVERAANGEEGPRYRAYFELPRDRHNATGWGGKVYGVCTLVRDDVQKLGRVETRGVEWDLEGRVLITEIEIRKADAASEDENEKLVIINGYWPNGTMNPWRDSNTGIVKGTRHDMKRNFHSLMLTEVLQHQEAGSSVVLVGDMNIARSPLDGYPGIRLGAEHVRNRREWNEMFIEGENGMKGIDSWRWIHGQRRGYSYHGEQVEEWGCSCDRVDLGVVSRSLVGERVKETEMKMRLVQAEIWESVEERGGSDHVPISMVLDLGALMHRPERA